MSQNRELHTLKVQIRTVRAELTHCIEERTKQEAAVQNCVRKRKKAEVDLKQCVTDRQALTEKLEKCKSDSKEALEALDQCSRNRKALEAKLTQCVKLDRPRAERGLAKCAQDRAKLEKRLAELKEQLSGAGGGEAAEEEEKEEEEDLSALKAKCFDGTGSKQGCCKTMKGSCQTRERWSVAKKKCCNECKGPWEYEAQGCMKHKFGASSLLETGSSRATEEIQAEMDEVRKEMRKNEEEARSFQKLIQQANHDFEEAKAASEEANAKEAEASAQLSQAMGDAQAAVDEVAQTTQDEADAAQDSDEGAKELGKAAAALAKELVNEDKAQEAIDAEAAAEDDAGANLQGANSAVALLLQQAQAIEGAEVISGGWTEDQDQHRRQGQKKRHYSLVSVERLVGEKSAIAGKLEACAMEQEESRARMEETKESPPMTAAPAAPTGVMPTLQLNCKKVLEDLSKTKSAMIDVLMKLAECRKRRLQLAGALKACEDARAELAVKLKACLDAKANLAAAVRRCHENLAGIRVKLQRCLDTKKELGEKIARCHKARDEAQAKWDKCEEEKKTLNRAIARLEAALEGDAALLQMKEEHKMSKKKKLEEHRARLGKVSGDYEEAATAIAQYAGDIEALLAQSLELDTEMELHVADLSASEVEEDGLRSQLRDHAGELSDLLEKLAGEDQKANDLVAAFKALADRAAETFAAMEEHAIVADQILDEVEMADR